MEFCQSCGMPLENEEMKGTNKDKSINHEYCTYCFQGGDFTQNISMDEMIAHCSQFVDQINENASTKMTKEEAVAQMKQYFPALKRWAKA